MKAVGLEAQGELEQIKILDIGEPASGPHDVIVKTEYAALNHLDIFVTAGWPGLNLKFPHVLGSDGAGIVVETGDLVKSIKVGDRVTINPGIGCGSCSHCLSGRQNLCSDFHIKGEHIDGTFAEKFKIPERNVLRIPDNVSMKDAAAAPLAFLTAWRMLTTRARLKIGEFLFVQGGSGGVSTCAIQIGKMLNAKVIASTSTDQKAEKLKEIGADFVVNYNETPDYEKHVYKDITDKQGIDVVVDSVGEATFEKSIKMLKPGGRFVTCGATTGPYVSLNMNAVFWKQLEILGSTMSNHREFLEVMSHVFSNRLSPVIDRIFSMNDAPQAQQYLAAGDHVGKILLKVN